MKELISGKVKTFSSATLLKYELSHKHWLIHFLPYPKIGPVPKITQDDPESQNVTFYAWSVFMCNLIVFVCNTKCFAIASIFVFFVFVFLLFSFLFFYLCYMDFTQDACGHCQISFIAINGKCLCNQYFPNLKLHMCKSITCHVL